MAVMPNKTPKRFAADLRFHLRNAASCAYEIEKNAPKDELRGHAMQVKSLAMSLRHWAEQMEGQL